jgi:predicted ATP-dependent Lon-type protease
MDVYADLIFDAMNPEGDLETFVITTRFRDKDQLEKISSLYLFDDIISSIEEILPLEYYIDSEIEFGTIYTGVVPNYDLDLSWVQV